MEHTIQYLAEAIKQARLKKGLSQRALSLKVKIPQSHISKIEKGQVNLQASSLVGLARVLDMELILIPQALVPATLALLKPSDQQVESVKMAL